MTDLILGPACERLAVFWKVLEPLGYLEDMQADCFCLGCGCLMMYRALIALQGHRKSIPDPLGWQGDLGSDQRP